MCPYTRRFILKDSSLVLVIVMPGAGLGLQVRRGECSPQDSQASTISLDTIEQWQPSAGGAPQASVDDRITEILVTLNSLSAELANISRARQQESSERLAMERALPVLPLTWHTSLPALHHHLLRRLGDAARRGVRPIL